ncbi:hypothetical protein BCR35DRAFT_62849 [Leucosporidium creatinivorum]|uniref:Uncharacterized protein n=1 Tax=Leucosporidium creatinivorum TaxID=106004 RepID=A0A1Y2FJQ5_9BASI|nr:hypothetical protein BCR35DRAFT_62849 [Leucosporidium creatinivorum]
MAYSQSTDLAASPNHRQRRHPSEPLPSRPHACTSTHLLPESTLYQSSTAQMSLGGDSRWGVQLSAERSAARRLSSKVGAIEGVPEGVHLPSVGDWVYYDRSRDLRSFRRRRRFLRQHLDWTRCSSLRPLLRLSPPRRSPRLHPQRLLLPQPPNPLPRRLRQSRCRLNRTSTARPSRRGRRMGALNCWSSSQRGEEVGSELQDGGATEGRGAECEQRVGWSERGGGRMGDGG